MRCCSFLIMSIELLHPERSFDIVEPNNFAESACKTSAPSIKGGGWVFSFCENQ